MKVTIHEKIFKIDVAFETFIIYSRKFWRAQKYFFLDQENECFLRNVASRYIFEVGVVLKLAETNTS